MSATSLRLSDKVVLVTGAAKRLGAVCVRQLHASGANVVVHYHTSESAAAKLVDELNSVRSDSACRVGTALGTRAQAEYCVEQARTRWGKLDRVVNNASSFFPTPVGDIDDEAVSNLLGSNFIAPLFIAQAAKTELARQHGAIVNMVDIHAYRPYKDHPVYCSAKAALAMLTQSLALELAPEIRVNAIAPGAILWPEDGSMSEDQQLKKIQDIPLARRGTAQDIAELVVYLCSDAANYVTGEIIKVDGGRSL